MIIGFISVKGGVGKTTIALETAASLANDFGKSVMLIDANFSAPNLSLHLGLEPEITLHDALLGVGLHNAIYERHGIDVVPAALVYKHEVDTFKLKKALDKFKKRYDYIIIDSSPHFSELIPVINAADCLFVVTTPDIPTLTMTMKAANLARQRKTPVEGVIINKIRDHKYELDLNEIEEGLDVPVVARIKDHRDMIESIHLKTPMILHKPENPVSQEIRRFASALVGRPEKPRGFFQSFLPFRNFFVHKEKVNRELLREKFYEPQLAEQIVNQVQ